ncbi:DUF5677 domain-containing protein [Candidatus Latescibacterota bacterium]
MAEITENGYIGKEYQKAFDRIREENQLLFSLAGTINSFCHEVLGNIVKVRSNNIQEITAILLFIRVHEAFQGCILLARKGMISSASMISRCMIDPVCILKLISEKPEFVRDYILSSKRDKLNILKKAKKIGVDDIENIEEDIKSLSEEIDSHCIPVLTSTKLLEDAGLFKRYGSAFVCLSEYIHSTSRNLEEEYMVLNDSREVECIIAGPKDKNLDRLIVSVITFVIDSMDSISTIFNIELSKTEKYKKELLDIHEMKLKSDSDK